MQQPLIFLEKPKHVEGRPQRFKNGAVFFWCLAFITGDRLCQSAAFYYCCCLKMLLLLFLQCFQKLVSMIYWCLSKIMLLLTQKKGRGQGWGRAFCPPAALLLVISHKTCKCPKTSIPNVECFHFFTGKKNHKILFKPFSCFMTKIYRYKKNVENPKNKAKTSFISTVQESRRSSNKLWKSPPSIYYKRFCNYVINLMFVWNLKF